MKTILGKLWLGITGLVILIILLFWLFQVVLLNKFHIAERKNYLVKQGEKIAEIFLNNDLKITNALLDEMTEFSSYFDTALFVNDSKGNIIYTNLPLDRVKGIIRAPQFNLRENKIYMREIYILSGRFPHYDSPFIIVKIPIIRDNVFMGNVMMTSPIAPIEETTIILQKQLTIISLISLIIATIAALIFSKYFTKPILNITDASKKIAKGDFSVSVDLKREDEIGVLGDTINNMAVQLGQTEEFRKDFIANTSHELKTPISLIRAYSELIKDMDIEKDKQNEYLEIIIDESNRLNNIVEDILYLSKIESGFDKPQITQFNIIDVINGVLEKLDYFAKQREISIEKITDSSEALIYADEGKMYQVIYNIVNNAINYSFSGGSIYIKVMKQDTVTRLEVIDEGKGISKEDLPHIWDRFYKADKSRKRDEGGTGLGMSIVKNILDTHGFRYGIESKINKGTTVWIEIDKQ